MNERIQRLKDQALKECLDKSDSLVQGETITLREFHNIVEDKFVNLLLADLADELIDVARGSKKVNPEWANGVNHAAMLAQRMTMNLPKEEK